MTQMSADAMSKTDKGWSCTHCGYFLNPNGCFDVKGCVGRLRDCVPYQHAPFVFNPIMLMMLISVRTSERTSWGNERRKTRGNNKEERLCWVTHGWKEDCSSAAAMFLALTYSLYCQCAWICERKTVSQDFTWCRYCNQDFSLHFQ